MSEEDLDFLDRVFAPSAVTADPDGEVWKTKDGRVIPVKKMDDQHLLNTIRFLLAEEAKLRLVGIDGNETAFGRKVADQFVDSSIKRNQEKRKMLVREADRRELRDWLKFGLSSSALEILDAID